MDETRETRRPTNGTARIRVPTFAAAGGVPYDDPMSRVLGLDAKTSGIGAWFGFTSGGTLLLVGLMALSSIVAAMHLHAHVAPPVAEEIDIMKEEAPPPPAASIAETEAEAQKEPEPAPPPPPRAQPKEAPPPPAPAQAGKVLAADDPDPDAPIDFTQGNGPVYAGGFTTSNGTSTTAVTSMPSPTGKPGGTGPVQAPPPVVGPDRSRMAGPGNSDWSNCPFPEEADTAQIDDAIVQIQVDVRPDGTPASVRVLSDPGNGFGREARRCAMNKRYQTALDHDGHPIAGTTRPFNVHFSR
jgi:protein TonB